MNGFRARCLPLVLLIGLWGCGHLKSSVQESMTTYPSPSGLSCGDGTGLLVIDGVSSRPLNTLDLTGAAIHEVESPGATILAGTFNTGGMLSSGSSLVAFQELPAGTYRISRLRFANANYQETLQLPSMSAYEVQIESGGVRYFGKVEARKRVGTSPPEIQLNQDVETEREAWSKVLKKFSDSGCAPLIRKHLETIAASPE